MHHNPSPTQTRSSSLIRALVLPLARVAGEERKHRYKVQQWYNSMNAEMPDAYWEKLELGFSLYWAAFVFLLTFQGQDMNPEDISPLRTHPTNCLPFCSEKGWTSGLVEENESNFSLYGVTLVHMKQDHFKCKCFTLMTLYVTLKHYWDHTMYFAPAIPVQHCGLYFLFYAFSKCLK